MDEKSGVVGIGTDLVDIPRIESLLQRQGEAFIEKVFSPQEITYCANRAKPAMHYAARFAAKEACSKAFGCGIGKELGFQDMIVLNDSEGAPILTLSKKAQALLESKGASHVHLSLTHTDTLAQAFVVIST